MIDWVSSLARLELLRVLRYNCFLLVGLVISFIAVIFSGKGVKCFCWNGFDYLICEMLFLDFHGCFMAMEICSIPRFEMG